ncbi:hypothetical protein ACJJTC_018884 [Scirpophaga incertulas]
MGRGWVCENAGFGPLAQAMFFAGSFVGGIFFGWLADTFGRVPALVGTNLLGCVGGVASIYTSGLWDFAFCRFIVGMSYDSCFMMMYILVPYATPSDVGGEHVYRPLLRRGLPAATVASAVDWQLAHALLVTSLHAHRSDCSIPLPSAR